jgi:crotonobetainyl-CoA:carnitine CoA-transferase CaiB-like acyl-CoA transferase
MLQGLRVVELASEAGALAGKMLADLGAEVIVVEPPGGHVTRTYGPFVEGRQGDPESSLWWWYYNTSKRSAVIDLESVAGRQAFEALVTTADIVLEGEPPGRLEAIDLDHPRLRAETPSLIWVSVTPFGRGVSAADVPATDLTILAGGGPVWSCGYDDHSVPPVRGGGNQAFHMGSTFAIMGALTALLARDQLGTGQHVDVSMHAAANVTTESASFEWLVGERTVQRQTGRHAMTSPTMETQALAADGRYVSTGFPPHDAKDYAAMLDWLDEVGVRDEFADSVLLQLGVDRGGVDYRSLSTDAEASAIYGAGREALCFIASRLSAYDFFLGAQQRDFQCGVVYSPEEAFADPHFVAREFPTSVAHPELDREIAYPGAPFKSSTDGWRISRRPPLVGEHTEEVLEDIPWRDAPRGLPSKKG